METEAPAPEINPEDLPPVEPTPEAPAEPTYDWADETVQTRGREAIERFERYGDVNIDQAVDTFKALGTEEGQVQALVSLANQLGVPQSTVLGWFENPTGAPAPEPEPEPDGDAVVTWDEARAYFEKQLDARLTQRDQQAQQQTAQQQAFAVGQAAYNEVMKELGIPSTAEQAVASYGDKYMDPNDQFNPEKIKAAIRRGHAEWQNDAMAEARRYVERKRSDADRVPTPNSGGSPGGSDQPEPQNVTEGIMRARARLRAQGVL